MKNYKPQTINHPQNNQGFTLAELLVAISIALLLLGALYTVYAISQSSFKYGSEKIELTQNAKIGLERITRELRETNQITTVLPAVGDDPENPPVNEITFQDANFTQIRYINYYLSGNDLSRRVYHYYLGGAPDEWVTYDTPEALSSLNEEQIIANNITNLEFYGQAVITINLSAQLGSKSVNLTTQISPRNI